MPSTGIVTRGLTMMLDGANPASLSSGSQYFYDLTGNNNHATMSNFTYVEDYGGSCYLNDNWYGYGNIALPINCNNLMLTSSFSMFFAVRRDFLGNRVDYSSRNGENGSTTVLKGAGDYPFTTGWGLTLLKQYPNYQFGGGEEIDPETDNITATLYLFGQQTISVPGTGPVSFIGLSVSGSQITVFHNGDYTVQTKVGYTSGANIARIGLTYFGNSSFNSLNGTVNAVYLYDRPLSIDELQQNYEFLRARTINPVTTQVTSSQLNPIAGPVLLYNALTASSWPGSGSIWYNISEFSGSNMTLVTGSTALSGSIIFNVSQSARNPGGQIPYAHLDRSVTIWAKTPSFAPDAGQPWYEGNTLYGFYRNQYNENIETHQTKNLSGTGLITDAAFEYSNSEPFRVYSYPVRTDQWYQYTFVGDYINRIKKLYINGEKVDEFSSDINPINIGSRATIANSLVSGKNWWKGEISYVSTHNRVLTDLEISQSYESLKSNFPGTQKPLPPAPEGLILHLDSTNPVSYPGSGSTWYDLSGYDNHAIFPLGTGSFLPDKSGSIQLNGVPCNIDLFLSSSDYRFGNNETVTIETVMNILDSDYAVYAFTPYHYLIFAGGTMYFTITNNWSGEYYTITGDQGTKPLVQIPITAGYQHITFVVAANTRGGDKLYVNGKLYYQNYNEKTLQTRPLLRGLKRFGTGMWTFNGSRVGNFASGIVNLNLIKVYNKELTSTEISQSFTTYQSRVDPALSYNTPVLPQVTEPVLILDASNPLSYPGSGSKWTDISGYGQLATAFSCSFTGSAGGALVLTTGSSEIGSFVNINSTFEGDYTLGNLENITLEIWAKTPLPVERMMTGFLKYNIFNSAAGFGFNTANSDVYGISAATLDALNVKNNWAQYVFIFNSKQVTNSKIYINGTEQSLSQVQGTPLTDNLLLAGGFCKISGWYNTRSFKMAMELGLVKMYNRSLSAGEITTNFNNTKTRFGI
jgi:hypothetical protein